jgi:hypothetical protein
MQHIQGISRNQLQMGRLKDKITADNPVRFIDAFVKTQPWSLSLSKRKRLSFYVFVDYFDKMVVVHSMTKNN